MRWLIALYLLVWTGSAYAAPKDAVVRIGSHGGSGTCIATGPGYTLILSAGHMFGHGSKPLVVDLPTPVMAPAQKVGLKVLRVDQRSDLALVLLNAGPVPYVSPVAPEGFRPGVCLSVGYDDMQIPGQVRLANIVKYEGPWTLTRERPWHGRSGGGLIDQRTGYLVGVVSAYEGPKDHRELSGKWHGVYASHASVIAFLRGIGPSINVDDPGLDPFRPQNQDPCPGGH